MKLDIIMGLLYCVTNYMEDNALGCKATSLVQLPSTCSMWAVHIKRVAPEATLICQNHKLNDRCFPVSAPVSAVPVSQYLCHLNQSNPQTSVNASGKATHALHVHCLAVACWDLRGPPWF